MQILMNIKKTKTTMLLLSFFFFYLELFFVHSATKPSIESLTRTMIIHIPQSSFLSFLNFLYLQWTVCKHFKYLFAHGNKVTVDLVHRLEAGLTFKVNSDCCICSSLLRIGWWSMDTFHRQTPPRVSCRPGRLSRVQSGPCSGLPASETLES